MAGGKVEKPRRFSQPNYFECARALDRLRRFQDLVHYYFDMPHEVHRARPIEQLIQKFDNPYQQTKLLEREINRLIPLMSGYLFTLGIPTEVEVTGIEVAEDIRKPRHVTKALDMIGNLFEISNRDRLSAYRLIMGTLEQGTGVLEAHKEREHRRLYSPLTWMGLGLRMPITALERAGVDIEEASSSVLKVYSWVLRLLMVAILLFTAAKLGLSIPWNKLLGFVLHSE
jgi:hypothetical protein